MKRRAEIAGELKSPQERMSPLSRHLETLDAALKLVAPDLDTAPIAPKVFRPPGSWPKRGEMSRTILDRLRRSRSPMMAREIAAEMIVAKGVNATTALFNKMSKRLAGVCRDKREQGVVRSYERTGSWL